MASFLDLFTATDSEGVSASRYRLHFMGSQFQNQDSWIFGMATELIYAVFQLMIIPANAMLGLVLSAGSWLDPLSNFYQKLAAPLFEIAPPWAIACFGMGIVAVSLMTSRPESTKSDLFNSAAMKRVGTALAMVAVVLVLTHDPFALMSKLLEVANGFSVGLAAAVTGSAADTTISAGQALVNASVRTPTIALNYGREFSAACSTQWSEAMLAGQTLSEDSGCFVKGQDAAGADTLATALVMLILPAMPMLAFAGVATWKYLQHLTFAVFHLLATCWEAAISVQRRRGFDKISERVAKAGAHLVMAVITSMVAVALPTLCTGLATDLLGLIDAPQAQAFALMVSLGVGFAVSTWVILRITSNQGALVRVLQADTAAVLESSLGTEDKKLKLPEKSVNLLAPKKASVLADDPVDATASPEVDAANATQPKGTNPVDNRASDADKEATEQLMEPGGSMAEAASGPKGSTVQYTSTPGPTAAPANRTWQQNTNNSTQTDTFGYFYAHSDSSNSTGPALVPAAGDTTAQGYPAPAEIPGGGSTGTGATGAENGASALAPQERLVPETSSDVAREPVSGNVYADPALDAAARQSGATLTVGGPPPTGRRIWSQMRGFRRSAPAKSPLFAPAEVQYAPPLEVTSTAASVEGEDPDQSADDSDPINDQQWWNRMSRLGRLLRRPAVTSPEPEAELPPSGIGAGPTLHPGSFCAAPADFLAGAALLVEMEIIGTAAAADGKQVIFRLPPNDQRTGIRLSTDPGERVVLRGVEGFGDP